MSQELKARLLGQTMNVYGCDTKIYFKDEVDAVLAEKDATIAELKAKLESVQASMYADVVDAGMENHRLKRALWIARAWRAESVMEYLTMKCKYFEKSFSIDVPKCDVNLLAKWAKIIPKCRAKAEEYK